MHKETLEMYMKTDMNALEVQIALQCAPVLVKAKVSNLLILRGNELPPAAALLRRLGVCFYVLRQRNDMAALLVYSGRGLVEYLQRAEVEHLLGRCGYASIRLGTALPRLALRYKACLEKREGFPHEIGLFLGYPVDDVEGFIKNGGRNYLYAGYWKVYSHVEEKKILFSRYNAVIYWFLTVLARGGNLEECIQERKTIWQKQ